MTGTAAVRRAVCLMALVVALLLAFSAAFCRLETAAAQGGGILDCLPTDARLWYNRVELDAAAVEAWRAVPAVGTFWLGYDAGGFDPVVNTPPAASFGVRYGETATGAYTGTVIFWLHGETAYVMVFADLTPFADAAGQHYGSHPCAAVTADGAAVRALLEVEGGGE